MRDSIFISVVRAFFVGLFSLIGVIIGLFLLIFLLIAFAVSGDKTVSGELSKEFSVEVLENGAGIRKTLSKDAPVILQIEVEGFIGSEKLNTAMVRRMLAESKEETFSDRIKAILLHINSPGGTVTDAYGIFQAIKDYKERYQIPVHAYVDGMCASGAMYIACAADKIYSNDVSLIGSVGVLLSPPFFNFTKLIEKFGVEALTLSAGKGKDEMNSFRPWEPSEEKNLQQLLDYYYNQFVDIVVAHRPAMTKEKLINEYGAYVFNPIQATEYGFIDQNNYTLNRSLEELAHLIGATEDKYQVVSMRYQTWYSELFSSESPLFKGKMTHQLQIYPDIAFQSRDPFLYLYRP